jgi:hypothetical protein
MTPRSFAARVSIGGAATLLALAAACSSDHIDRRDAIARVVEDGGGRVDEEQAACYVDRVLDEIGSAPLRPGADLTPEQEARSTAVRVDCIGFADLGAGPDPTVTPSAPSGSLAGPRRRGDAPELDALSDSCAAGFGQSCDELFARAVLGSEYEAFAASCGGRTRELLCATVYPEPGVVLPSDAQPTTSVPPPSP